MNKLNINELNTSHFHDVTSYLKECSDVFGQLGAILNVIKNQTEAHSDITKLASAGLFIARDYENIVDCWHGESENILRLSTGANHE